MNLRAKTIPELLDDVAESLVERLLEEELRMRARGASTEEIEQHRRDQTASWPSVLAKSEALICGCTLRGR